MAGDWIKMRVDLAEDPAVIGMAIALGIDEYGVVGRLHKLWSWADKHCTDGHAKSVTSVWIDRYIGHEGFAKALTEQGWLVVDSEGVAFPKFDRHNGKSAKTRLEASERKRLQRERDKEDEEEGQESQKKRDKTVTREEKRRVTTSPIPPDGGEDGKQKKTQAIALKTFLENCRRSSDTPIPESDPVFAYADKVGLPSDFLRLQWLEFKDRYMQEGAKRYKAWPVVFRKSVQGNWFKLWFVGAEGKYALTTVGQQAQRSHQGAA